MQQQMMQQQMMEQQMQQQMMQQQMMQQQMFQAQQDAERQNILNKNINTELCVIFRASGVEGATPPEMVECKPGDKVSKIIERYRRQSGDKDLSKKFIFNARALHPSLTVAEAGLTDNANIFVVETKGVRGG